jgi:AcrR family transcriptional regulator
MDVRESLLQAAVKLFAESGTRGATTRRIAEAAGVNEVTLFRHFGSKEALIRDALRWASQRALVARLPESPRLPEAELTEWCRAHHANLHRMRALIRTGMAEHEEHPDMAASTCQGPLRVAAELHTYMVRLREAGLVAADVDLRAASAMLLGAMFGDAIGRDIMPERYPYPLRDAAAKYVRLFLRAIAPEPAARRRRTLEADHHD